MNTYNFVHLALHATGGEIKGKTMLQKTVYFLGVLTGELRELGYRPHFYGPYSAEVAGAVDRLRGLGFVEQSVVGGGAVDHSGFEVARYDFRLNDEGRRMAEAKAARYPEEWKKIRSAVARLKKAKAEDYIKLSVAAKTFFMLGEKPENASIVDLVSLAERFGWSVTPDQVKEAAHFLDEMGLVKLSIPK